jgi:hypothetical protein
MVQHGPHYLAGKTFRGKTLLSLELPPIDPILSKSSTHSNNISPAIPILVESNMHGSDVAVAAAAVPSLARFSGLISASFFSPLFFS